VNMFTQNVKPAKPAVARTQRPAGGRTRGRPRGQTAQGAEAARRLFDTAIGLIGERGYEATTLRDVADRAGVSVGLLYRYFPSKRAIVLALYEALSAEYAQQATAMREGKWRDRFIFALETSLGVLGPHRPALTALVPVMVGGAEDNLFAPGTAASRVRVQQAFKDAVIGAADAPARKLAESLGRLLYLAHLAVILWWLLDKSPRQRATKALVAVLRQALPSFALMLRLPPIRSFVQSADELFREALFDEAG